MKKVAVGIDIGGTNTKFGIVDKKGSALFESSIPTKADGSVDDFFKDLKEKLLPEIEKLSSDTEIIGVGIGAPNANYYKGTIEHAPNIHWGEIVPFTEKFKAYFDMPVVITNDANAAALGEMVYGNAKNIKHFILITLGTGLGSGIVVNGKLVYGHDGFAGELGHMNVNPTGRQCGCGKSGCLETYVSATGIRRTVYKLLADYKDASELRDISYNFLTGKMITEAALRNDPIALRAFEYTGKILGMKLADSVVHTSPEAIFLFGGLVNAGDYLMEPTRRNMEEYMMPIFKGKVKVLESGLQNKNAGLLGAAALAWDEFDDQFDI